mgnify:CR=1 FL=1
MLSVIPNQVDSDKPCVVLVEPYFKGSVAVFDKPSGKVVATFKQDFENEDYLTFTVTKQSPEFFYGNLEYSISGEKVKG